MTGLFLAATCQLIVVGAQKAEADEFNTCFAAAGGRGWCRTDSNPMDWCLTDSMDSFPRAREAAARAMNRLDDLTIINSGAATTCGPNVDAKWRNNPNLGDETQGRSLCQDWHNTPSGIRCNASQVEVNMAGVRYAADTVLFNPDGTLRSDGRVEDNEVGFNLDKTACHELGHATGLPHHDRSEQYFRIQGNDCTVSGWLDSPEQSGEGWMTINVDHRLASGNRTTDLDWA